MGFVRDTANSLGSQIGNVLGSFTGATQAGEAAEKAGALQAQMSEKGIAEQKRQFDKTIEIFNPYVTAGTAAIGGLQPYTTAGAAALDAQQALAGLKGAEAQRLAVNQLATNPEFAALVEQGERALLQRASATGGLRSGNVQEALAQFRPQMLSDYINQQYTRLGGFTQLGQQTAQNIAQLGQASAAGQATSGLQTAANISGLLGEKGAALAGGIMGKGGITGQTFSDLLSIGSATVGAVKAGAF